MATTSQGIHRTPNGEVPGTFTSVSQTPIGFVDKLASNDQCYLLPTGSFMIFLNILLTLI